MRKIAFAPPDITDEEIREVVEAMRSGWITTGPQTKLFEQKIAEYVGTQRAVCLNSATAAMELTLRILGIGPGDEVITTPYTYSASAAVIEHVGAKIVFIDLAPGSYEMDYDRLEGAITERTKAVIPVDIGGRMCDYDAIYRAVSAKSALYRPHNALQELYDHAIVIADSAHAFGATQKGVASGLVADFTCFSFHAVKNMTTAEGGAVVWRGANGLDDEWLYNQYMLFSLHGQNKDALAKSRLGGWEYDILFPGFKCNMPDILASFGLIQLRRYPALEERRHQMITKYNGFLKGQGMDILKHHEDGAYRSTGHLYMTRVHNMTEAVRSRVIGKLAERGISANVHFKPLPMMTGYRRMGFSIDDFPNAYAQYANEITLPLHTLLSDDDVAYVAENYLDILKSL